MHTIRPMTIADYDAAYSLWQNVAGMSLGASDTREQISRFLERNPGLSFVCETDGRIVGTILCSHDNRRGYIYHLAVDAAYRRKGVGSSLLKKCTSLLAQEGVLKCTILVCRENDEGRRFWEHMGWRLRSDIDAFSQELLST
jgi:ribosomal protein S18 acetylase RimI-like enzyme